MDSEVIYAVGGIIGFIIIIIMVLRSNPSQIIKTKDEKREEILRDYKKQLRDTLAPYKDEKNARISKKSMMLKKFSDELALNIFFDNTEIKDIILELAKES